MATAPRPPRARAFPIVGLLPSFVRDPYATFERAAREHGDVVALPIPGLPLVLVSHPDHVKHITNTAHASYPKPGLLSDVMFSEPPRFHGMANGEDWRRVRKMLNPKFSARGLASLQSMMIDAVVDAVDGWDRFAASGATVDMQEQLGLTTLSVMLRSMFTRQASEAEVARLASSFVDVGQGMAIAMITTPLPARVPRPFDRRYAAAKAHIVAFIDRMIAERRAHPVEQADLLSMLLEAEFDDGSRMDDTHIERELLGLLFAGYETTAAVMSWVIAHFATEHAARERAYEEVDALGGRRVAPDDVTGLSWLRACFDEAQRLQGFPINAREATEDDEIGGYAIPKGTTVGFSGQVLHRDPRWWRAPERFMPERFLEDEINPYAFLPFGVGPRRCLGMRMAYMVGVWTLASALQRYRFVTPADWRPERRFAVAGLVKGGVPVELVRRDGAA